LYQRHNSLDEIDHKTVQQIQEQYFRRSFDEVWKETKAYYMQIAPQKFEEIERNPKRKMALIFRRYFFHTSRLALEGVEDQKVDYQIHCGPALGAFNQWVKGTEIEPWQNRYVADVARRLMQGTAELLNERFNAMTVSNQAGEAPLRAAWQGPAPRGRA
jgi:trans-AT polyketide synthase/acyltransferase/oxidoreductase domain-containing protein